MEIIKIYKKNSILKLNTCENCDPPGNTFKN